MEAQAPNKRLERSRGRILGSPRVDDLDKSASLDVDATPRRSTSTLGPIHLTSD
jgi:hypothetical protein